MSTAGPYHDGPVVVVTSRVASRIARPLGRLLREAREGGERLDDEVVATVAALERASHHFAASRVAAGSATGTSDLALAELTSWSAHGLTTGEVADRLGCSERNVTKLLTTGRLTGRRAGRAWLVDPDSVARLLHDREQSA